MKVITSDLRVNKKERRFSCLVYALSWFTFKCIFGINILIQLSFVYLIKEREDPVFGKDNPIHCKLFQVLVLLLAPPSNTSWTLLRVNDLK